MLLSVGVYEAPAEHGAVSDLIRRHSTNPRDIREVALEGVDVTAGRRFLDLGCGFGFMAEALARKAKRGAEILGVDVNASNRRPLIGRIDALGCCGRFVCRELVGELPFASREFDGVVASYALYFFPRIVPDIARVLAPGGFFITLTHSEASMASLLEVLGLPEGDSPQARLLHGFSAETGGPQLRRVFRSVEETDYRNALAFQADGIADLLAYVRFKLPLIRREIPPGAPVPASIERRLRRMLADEGRIVIRKDDRIFRCWDAR